MKFLLDVCPGEFVENQVIIRNPSNDFKTIRSINPKMLDIEILRLFQKDNRIIITSDKDFGELVFKNNLHHKGILLVRIDELQLDERIHIITKILTDHNTLLKNKFCVFKNNGLRIRF